jgi:hypothetical protein
VSSAAISAAIRSSRSTPRPAKRAGWRQHGILVAAEQDPRLSWPERELVRHLGTRLYGQRGAADD